MRKINWILPVILLILLVYTRFINLSWGLPYPFHPDERNMADALQRLSCSNLLDLKNCLNPHFFAYGQFPLYLGYFFVQLSHFLSLRTGQPTSFLEAIIILRLISAISSILTVFVAFRIVKLISKESESTLLEPLSTLLLTFSPALIQFAHFGTTESLLMLFYTLIIYSSLKKKFLLCGVVAGAAVATKVSSIIFFAVPLIFAIALSKAKIKDFIKLIIPAALSSFFLSPHNLISFADFTSAIHYESDVGLGQATPFYTRQFANKIPVIFQFSKIFPYVLGWPILILFVLGFLLLPYSKKFNLLRLSFLIYFIPSALIYAKWTRFLAPIFPLMIIFSILCLWQILSLQFSKYLKNIIFGIIIFVAVIPGVAYLSIYQNPDVRFRASEWIYKNIPEKTTLLFDTANVVDVPIPNPHVNQKTHGYNMISFNFYDLETDPSLQENLKENISKADYILVPSRRVFANHSKNQYPKIAKYYSDLFSGKLGFKKVSEFTSYPTLDALGFMFQFPDEAAEETWTVFDHPVIRIYEKVRS